MTAATSLSVGTGTPRQTSASAGIGSGMALGMPLNTIVAVPRISAPRANVTMTSEMTGRATIWRSTRRLNRSASAIIPAQAKASAPASPRPIACSPAATSRAPNMTHSPSAKLITREAL